MTSMWALNRTRYAQSLKQIAGVLQIIVIIVLISFRFHIVTLKVITALIKDS